MPNQEKGGWPRRRERERGGVAGRVALKPAGRVLCAALEFGGGGKIAAERKEGCLILLRGRGKLDVESPRA